MTQPLTLAAIADDAAFLAHEHQLHFMDVAETLGENRWQVDLTARTLELIGERTLRTEVSLLGSTAENGSGASTWLWGWANPSGFSPEVTADGARVAEFGRQHGVPELAEPELPLDPAVVGRLVDAAKVITGRWTGYSGEAGPGTRVYFLVAAPELVLPAPTALRCVRVIGEVLSMGTVTDHRRAVLSYGRLRGVGADVDPATGTVTLRLPDSPVAVAFDGYGRIADISATAAPSAR